MRFHVRGVDHLCVCGSSVSSKLPEQVFPDATPRPAHKAIIDRCRRSILGRTIAPATAAFQNMHDAANDAAVVCPLDAPYIRRQMRFDPSPLLVAQPKQIPAHNPDPLPTTNQDRIVRAKKLMSFDPRFAGRGEFGFEPFQFGRQHRFAANDRALGGRCIGQVCKMNFDEVFATSDPRRAAVDARPQGTTIGDAASLRVLRGAGRRRVRGDFSLSIHTSNMRRIAGRCKRAINYPLSGLLAW
jgi:hypothetical protein